MTTSPSQGPVLEPPEAPPPSPRWLDEIDLTLSVCPQFFLYGNIRDSYLLQMDALTVRASLVDTLWARMRDRGYEFLLVFDPTSGLSVHPASALATARTALRGPSGLEVDFTSGDRWPVKPGDLPALVAMVYGSGACGLVIQNASRLAPAPSQLSPQLLEALACCAQSAQTARPRPTRPPRNQPLFNPVFWLLDSIHDLPPWLVVGGERNRAVSVALPDRDDRQRSAALLATDLAQSLTGDALQKAIDRFAIGSDGLTLKEMSAIAHIAADRDVSIDDIGDAIRYYKVGVTDNPWGSALVRQSIAQGEAAIGAHVIGQDAAVRQTLDILIRSVMGLHGAQVSSSSNRPRGVLFFAGPTGVGKTELAKSVSRLIFGHEDSCVRFDMSEFSAEHSEARLIGAPPGYIGHDAGGELVNAIRQRPFSVLLFDEIEKAHPRILDKFLQILEDGRLTDGRGDTVYFSESILIFTSNLGIVRKRGDGRDPEILVRRGDDPETVRTTIRAEISRHFREELSRPELLNRIGENVVVFDFITDEVAAQIFAKLVRNVSERVLRMLDLRIEFGPGVYDRLFEICRANLDDGGRGIGNMIEVALVNPLARELFAMETRGPIVTISDILHEGGKYSVRLE